MPSFGCYAALSAVPGIMHMGAIVGTAEGLKMKEVMRTRGFGDEEEEM